MQRVHRRDGARLIIVSAEAKVSKVKRAHLVCTVAGDKSRCIRSAHRPRRLSQTGQRRDGEMIADPGRGAVTLASPTESHPDARRRAVLVDREGDTGLHTPASPSARSENAKNALQRPI